MRRKFIILSQPRCGTHLLRSYLNCHPEICCYDEIFSDYDCHEILANLPRQIPAKRVIEAIWEHKSDKSVGFLVHDHQNEENSKHRWSHEAINSLKEEPLLIWLRRDNTLAQFASSEIAKKTQKWLSPNGNEWGNSKLNPQPIEVAKWIEGNQSRRKELRRLLARHDSISLSYEQLCSQPQKQLDLIFRKLGLFSVAVKTTIRKSRGYRISQIFENFEDIIEEIQIKVGASPSL